ncbi:MAG: 16S rRNA (guanine(527)-N(7))-methyltransferase RsmG [Acidobacteria bacterium]|nr:16S rRNA (guanine(527)-N(7))-methyltransferase RsmG [Acidobacteriota bacterium]
MNDLRQQFINTVEINQTSFGVSINDEKIVELADYYEFVQKHNAILHLVAPCSAEEFAVRHILESLTLLEFLPENAKFADVGAGAGLPALPCLIVRQDLHGVLIESKPKKADFLKEVLAKFDLGKCTIIQNKQFEELPKPDVEFITCRALDKFTQKLPKLLKWSKKSSLLLFGGNNLGAELEKYGVKFQKKLIPMSEQRFLFIAQN